MRTEQITVHTGYLTFESRYQGCCDEPSNCLAVVEPDGYPLAMAKQCSSTSGATREWEQRIFKNTYVRNGQTREVRHWAVRLQREGTRKTFSLSAPGRRAAAAEARTIYEALVREGWDSAIKVHAGLRNPDAATHSSYSNGEANALKDRSTYWNQRLMRRKYTEHVQAGAKRALSVRMGDESSQYWFPLGTDSEGEAAGRALEIHRTLQAQGWNAVCERYAREITIAIFWVVNPVAVTYTTIHTMVDSESETIGPGQALSAESRREGKQTTGAQPPRRVAVIEPDASIQKALKFWLDRQPGFRCSHLAVSADKLPDRNGSDAPELLLFNRALPEAVTARLMQTVKERMPDLPAFAYAVSEDIDQIFISLSGVKAGYIFRRRIPTELLEPIQGALRAETFSVKQVARHVRNYFSNLFESGGPIGGSPLIANLTAREGEILNLLSKGCVDKEIAELLRISVWTVHTHLRKIYEKLQVHTRTEAVVKFLGK